MPAFAFVILATCLLSGNVFCAPTTFKFSTVVLVPGDGGSQLWATLNKTTAPRWFCQKKTKSPFLLWLEPSELIWPVLQCLADNLKLHYNVITKTTTNTPGVNTFVPGFGETWTVEYLSTMKFHATAYFKTLTDYLVTHYGHVRNTSILGAPFDFRKAPNEQSDYFQKLANLIEVSYTKINKPVVLVAHSLGCKYVLHFLQRQIPSWKKKYIKAFVALAGPFGGASGPLLATTSGYNLGMNWIDPLWFRETQRSWPSTVYMLPSARIWKEDKVIINTPLKNYTVSDIKLLLADIGVPEMYPRYKDLQEVTDETIAPGVETHCLFGSGIDTPDVFSWNNQKNFPDSQPEASHIDGDGSVALASASVCELWKSRQAQAVKVTILKNASHVNLLHDRRFHDYLAQISLL